MKAWLVVIGLLGASTALGAEKGGGSLVRGPGSYSCGSWVEAHTAKSSVTDAQDFWVLGYLSAYNRLVPNGREDIAGGIDTAGIIAAITLQCQSHPLDRISQATEAVIGQMSTRP
jgi:hypothetical protein